MNLTPKEREIAIQAIAARADGSPASAARQIMSGVRALDGAEGPFVVWPGGSYGLPSMLQEERAAWHEAQAAEIRKSISEHALWWAARIGSVAGPESSEAQSHSGICHEPEQADAAPVALDASEAESVPPSAPMPAQEASDASQ